MRAGRVTPGGRLAAALTLAIVVTVTGCDRGAGGPLSKGEFIRKASSICQKANAQALAIRPPSLADPAAVEQAIGQIVIIQRDALDKLTDLNPPTQDEPGVEDWLHLVDKSLDRMERVRDAVRDGDQGALQDANAEALSFSDEAEQFATAYGITDCTTRSSEEERR